MEYSAEAHRIIDATKVDYRRLGRSGLKVSVPILGAMGFGETEGNPMKWVLPEEKALPLLKAAWDCGINTWDTANNYSNGSSEVIIGKAIKQFDIPRHKLILLTKCWAFVGESMEIPGFFPPVGPRMDAIRATPPYINQSGLSRQAIFNQVEASLARLGTDYIDLLQIHKADPDVPIEETMKALHDLVTMGKIRYIGASSMRGVEFAMLQHVAEKNSWTKFVSMQNQYNLLYREEEREMNFFCNATGVGIIPYSPLSRGHLARPPTAHRESVRGGLEYPRGKMYATGYNDADQAIIARVEEIARKKGWSMSDVALAWLNKRVSSPIVGFSTLERLHDTLTVRGKVLDTEEEEYLEEPYVPKSLML